MYNQKDKSAALDLWFAMAGTISLEDFVEELGYPSRTCLSGWIKADPRFDPDKPRYDSQPVLSKLQAIRRVAEGATKAQAARENGLTPASLGRAV